MDKCSAGRSSSIERLVSSLTLMRPYLQQHVLQISNLKSARSSHITSWLSLLKSSPF